jgi:hypothetical protein
VEIVGPTGGEGDAPRELAGAQVARGGRITLRAVWTACPRAATCGDGSCTSGESAAACPADCLTQPRGCTGAESYLWANPDRRVIEERREGISVAWYASAGTFDESQTGRAESEPDVAETTNGWVAPNAPGLVRLWLVIRDDRGGVGWLTSDVVVD